jgi:iron complex transport system substrate-binding protein
LNILLCCFPALLGYLFAAPAAAAIELKDDIGATIRLDRPAQSVIALAPHLTELVYAVGGGDSLAGVVRGSDWPREAAAVTQVGDSGGLDFERIVALQPDLVLAWGSGTRAADIERLHSLGIRVLILEPRRLADIPRHLQMLGILLDRRDAADAATDAFAARMDELRGRHGSARSVSVMFEIWHRPIITVNGQHIISDVIALCGGRNVFADLPFLAGEVSPEMVLAADPDAILVGSEAADAGPQGWENFGFLRAVRSRQVFSVPADLIARQTPRILDAAERICAVLEEVRRNGDAPRSSSPRERAERPTR